ncbi:MAG: hypothetical protein JWM80_3352 [Cyanobacteria bacterium RYN_339]|nr:hypothetical protein [Cyanobacteria bacterium RYN_339]
MTVHRVAGDLAVGMIAGLVGTLAMTAGQQLEMRLRKRKPSSAPAEAVERIFEVQAKNELAEYRLATAAHLGYGTTWGAFRGLVDQVGLRGAPASLLHAVVLQGAAMWMMPALKVAPPVKEWGAKEIAIEGVHHLVYATATGLTYELLNPRPEGRRPAWHLPAWSAAVYTGAKLAWRLSSLYRTPSLRERATELAEAARQRDWGHAREVVASR